MLENLRENEKILGENQKVLRKTMENLKVLREKQEKLRNLARKTVKAQNSWGKSWKTLGQMRKFQEKT